MITGGPAKCGRLENGIFKIFVDLIKAIAWPSAVFALGFMFRSDVRALFPRLKKAGPTGLEFDPARQVLAAVKCYSACNFGSDAILVHSDSGWKPDQPSLK